MNNQSVSAFIKTVPDSVKQKDCNTLKTMMSKITGKRAKMWGDSIVGFGRYHYKYSSGREGDCLITGFSPRKQNLTIYIIPGFSNYQKQLGKLGKHKHSKSCLYVKKLEDLNLDILEEIIADSVVYLEKNYVCN